jgi:hypothetical protein
MSPFVFAMIGATEAPLRRIRCLVGNMSGDHVDTFDDEEPLAYIGKRHVWGGMEPFGLLPEDRRQHVYCVGKSGTGKTTLLRNLIIQDIERGNGVGVIDPHGDLAEELLDSIPSWRTNDVVYFNPADLDYPIGLNLLQNVVPERRHRIASGVVNAFKSIWRESWGNRMEYILYAAVAALLDCQNTSILGIQRMLVDRQYRRWVVKQIKDPIVKSFWTREFENYSDQFMQEAIAPIQNKVGQLLMSPPMRNVLGQVKRKVDPRFIMDNRRILIANLSKGLLGEDKANLLGSLLVTSFELAALQRVDTPEADREDFHLYIDEFQNFATDSFATILSEARKYRLCLTLSHQYLDQLRPSVRNAVFGNAGTIISFRVGGRDAKLLSQEYSGSRPASEFSSLGNFEIVAKLISSGEHREPFIGRTLGPLRVRSGRRDAVVRRSREKYASRKGVVEAKINRWMKRTAA